MDSDTRYLGSRGAAPRPDSPPTTAALTLPAEIIPAGARRRVRAFVSRNANILPLALIALGLLIFFGRPNFAVAAVATIPLSLGLVFLYVYLQQGQQFQFLVPAALLTGLGLGAVVGAFTGFVALLPVGLGLGFCAIWYRERIQWWALFPGLVFSLAGGMWLLGQSQGRLGGWLPALLVGGGLWLLMSTHAMRDR